MPLGENPLPSTQSFVTEVAGSKHGTHKEKKLRSERVLLLANCLVKAVGEHLAGEGGGRQLSCGCSGLPETEHAEKAEPCFKECTHGQLAVHRPDPQSPFLCPHPKILASLNPSGVQNVLLRSNATPNVWHTLSYNSNAQTVFPLPVGLLKGSFSECPCDRLRPALSIPPEALTAR